MNSMNTTDSVYNYVRHYITQHGFSPSQREIGRDCYLAESTVRYHLKKLVAAGRINFDSGKVRTIGLPKDD
jgi:predicted transcriptional regulator